MVIVHNRRHVKTCNDGVFDAAKHNDGGNTVNPRPSTRWFEFRTGTSPKDEQVRVRGVYAQLVMKRIIEAIKMAVPTMCRLSAITKKYS